MKQLIGLSILLLLFACKEGNNGVEKGVSRELAIERKSMIGSVDYSLNFSIPRDRNEEVTGESVISFELLSLAPLILDFKAEKKQIISIVSEDRKIPYAFKNEHIIIDPKYLKEGRNVLTISFIAGDQSLNRQDDYLYTLLVPDRCRTLMPCFDQPDIKARFRLRLKIPSDWRSIGNGELIRREVFEDYCLCEFDQTKPISTYLFAFTVGKFEYTRQYSRGRWIGIFHRETDSIKLNHSIPAIADQVSYAIHWMERYTTIRYPFGHYNVVAIPAFQYGGMEHPGATYYRASSIFLEPDADQAAQMRRTELIAHETAHMWFGDLVTMKWFDDVWLKEVFAGLMADKILAGLYPGVNHRLSFFLNHYEPSLRTDRTQGSHPILQKLDNLKDAGTLYGDIIYHKAPIVMRMLEQTIKPYHLQRGLINYLWNWQYSNADWDDLIRVLEKTSGMNLQEWNNVWLKEGGAPVVEFTEEGIVVVDEKKKGRIWPQNISALRSNQFMADNVYLKDTLVKFPAMDVVLPDPEIFGYGSFLPSEKSIRFLHESLQKLPNPLYRAVAWQTLYNGVLFKKLKGETFIRICIKHLSVETNNLVINRTLSFLTTVYNTYLDEGGRQLLRDEVERFLVTILFKNQREINKKPFFKALLAVYSSEDTGNYIYKVLNGSIRREDLSLSDEDKLNVAYNIVLRNPSRYSRIKRLINGNVKNPDLLKRFAFVYPAVSGDKHIRDSVFQALLLPENRINEVWVTDALGWLNHPKCKMEAEEYLPEILEKLQETQITGDIFFPADWLRAGLSCHTSKYAYNTVCQFLEKHPNYPENLKLKILMYSDHLRRLHSDRSE